MTVSGFCLFDTALGSCGVSWGSGGLTSVVLPESSTEATAARLSRRFPGLEAHSPPDDVQAAIEAMASLLSGRPADLDGVRLDLVGIPEFNRRVYEITRRVERGKTTTYGAIAIELGDVRRAQAVGLALGRNPIPIVIPCHRVLAAGGRLGGFSGGTGATTKRAMLLAEGALPDEPLELFDSGSGQG